MNPPGEAAIPGNGLTFEKFHKTLDTKLAPLVHEDTCKERHKHVDDVLERLALAIEANVQATTDNTKEVNKLWRKFMYLLGVLAAVQIIALQVWDRLL